MSLTTCLFATTTCVATITPVQAESINIQFTGVVEERVSVELSPPQPTQVEVAATSITNLEIPRPTTQNLSVNSTQPVSIQVTSNQITQTQISNSSTENINLQLPLTNPNHSPTSNSELIPQLVTVTIVPN